MVGLELQYREVESVSCMMPIQILSPAPYMILQTQQESSLVTQTGVILEQCQYDPKTKGIKVTA